jgi:hypothetical protein
MASNFSANQYDRAFASKSLGNWEVPHWYPKHPRRRSKTTQFIANERGHLLPDIPRPVSSPWGKYQSTWQLPKRITREQANQINAPPVGGSRWAFPSSRVNKKIQAVLEDPVQPIKTEKPDPVKPVKQEAPEKLELKKESVKPKEYQGKEKLNNPISISRQSRSIRHETLERDDDQH